MQPKPEHGLRFQRTGDIHHIKKENIGLIEVMGLAVLPARLKAEMALLEQTILAGGNVREAAELEKHADWADSWIGDDIWTAENLHAKVQQEIGIVFSRVLECAGVFKEDEAGRTAFRRFTALL